MDKYIARIDVVQDLESTILYYIHDEAYVVIPEKQLNDQLNF